MIVFFSLPAGSLCSSATIVSRVSFLFQFLKMIHERYTVGNVCTCLNTRQAVWKEIWKSADPEMRRQYSARHGGPVVLVLIHL